MLLFCCCPCSTTTTTTTAAAAAALDQQDRRAIFSFVKSENAICEEKISDAFSDEVFQVVNVRAEDCAMRVVELFGDVTSGSGKFGRLEGDYGQSWIFGTYFHMQDIAIEAEMAEQVFDRHASFDHFHDDHVVHEISAFL
ncbi:hypothetical protein T4A_3553 [Trichinella pseudospiralis]|uniref:Uncharacterized protein n=1 Tax=Trichinella pseudospiralis TaxID=6337 RepID=A0A0V1E345_TRIPS|nr:hypothetical protein T4A_3553 [Trichinella pseudospiralis]